MIILDEPTAALGVKESAHVLELILKVRDSGIPVILISHNMPHVFEIADRIHIHRLGRRIAVISPKTHTMNEAVAIMTGATEPGAAVSAEKFTDERVVTNGCAAAEAGVQPVPEADVRLPVDPAQVDLLPVPDRREVDQAGVEVAQHDPAPVELGDAVLELDERLPHLLAAVPAAVGR